MLEFLRIRGLAIADDVQIDLHEGFNVLTGETGAGKSIVIDALSLVRGGRGRSALVREGSDALRVEAQFRWNAGVSAGVGAALESDGMTRPPEEDGALVVSRVVQATGRGRCRLHDELVSSSMLRRVGERILDICGQHEHHGLTRVERHREVVDAQASLGDLLESYVSEYRRWRAAADEVESLEATRSEARRRLSFVTFVVEELETVAPRSGEYGEMQARVKVLREAARWRGLGEEVRHEVYERDGSISELLGRLAQRAGEGAEVSPALAEVSEQLASAQIACEEASAAAARLLGDVEEDPAALAEVECRLDALDGLAHKHACDPEELPAVLETLRDERDGLEDVGGSLASAEARRDAAMAAACDLAGTLRARRLAAARQLECSVSEELAALQMPHARLEVRVEPRCDDGLLRAWAAYRGTGERPPPAPLDAYGTERVELYFCANAGEVSAPLAKVASGGELSRVLLALKALIHGAETPGTTVFDEVDSGVSGQAAEAIGERLSRVARERQVVCVTHLAQVAALADRHFRVEKYVEGGRTFSRVVPLDERGRVEELARMIGLGSGAVNESARRHARAMRKAARSNPRPGAPGFPVEDEEDVREVVRVTSGPESNTETKTKTKTKTKAKVKTGTNTTARRRSARKASGSSAAPKGVSSRRTSAGSAPGQRRRPARAAS